MMTGNPRIPNRTMPARNASFNAATLRENASSGFGFSPTPYSLRLQLPTQLINHLGLEYSPQSQVVHLALFRP